MARPPRPLLRDHAAPRSIGDLFRLFKWATRWGSRRRETLSVRAFTAGLAPLTIGLLLSTGWVLTDPARGEARLMALVAFTAIVMLGWRVSPLWLVGAGMLAGALGWV